jgi:hypothetical protein
MEKRGLAPTPPRPTLPFLIAVKYHRKRPLFPAPSTLDYYLPRNLTSGDCYARSHQRPINLWARGCSRAVCVEDPHVKCNWPNERRACVNATTTERHHDRPYRRSLVTSSLGASCHFRVSGRSRKCIRLAGSRCVRPSSDDPSHGDRKLDTR